jgi:hypothetical protein
MGFREEIISFIKKWDTPITIIIIVIVTVGLFAKGYIYSSRINSNSRLCYGILFKEGSKNYVYYFLVNGERFQGNIGGKKHHIGDTIVIQYFVENPIIHVIHSNKKQGTDIKDLQLNEISIWDTF